MDSGIVHEALWKKNLEYWANKAKSLGEREDQIQTKTELGLDFMTIRGLWHNIYIN